MGMLSRLVLAGTGILVARGAMTALRRSPLAHSLERVNHKGKSISLAAGPAAAVGASVSAAAGAKNPRAAVAALTAGLGAGAVGLYDDVVGAREDQKQYKGFKGHLAALQDGKVTSGLVKIVGVGAAGLTAVALIDADRRRDGRLSLFDTLVGAGVVAGAANVINLLDLRPGRALKATMALGQLAGLGKTPASGDLVSGPVAAAGALIGEDLDEKVMLGDAGANALGAQLGLALTAKTGRYGRLGLFALFAAATVASEKVSFTKVIEATPVLREIDRFGRKS
ncbi:hypothetical protein AB0I28_19545 [Phytomonospora sp. NPDC050363]|uniref:hypothetical protein n=1 Tax=Phytomonospora sp. NPDC050363 TaxID=3155642 RepID=UPI0033D4CD30